MQAASAKFAEISHSRKIHFAKISHSRYRRFTIFSHNKGALFSKKFAVKMRSNAKRKTRKALNIKAFQVLCSYSHSLLSGIF